MRTTVPYNRSSTRRDNYPWARRSRCDTEFNSRHEAVNFRGSMQGYPQLRVLPPQIPADLSEQKVRRDCAVGAVEVGDAEVAGVPHEKTTEEGCLATL